MKTRLLIAGGAVLVAGGLVALLLATRETKSTGAATAAGAEEGATPSGGRPGTRARRPSGQRPTTPPENPSTDDDRVDRIEVRDGGLVTSVREHTEPSGTPSPIAPQTVARLRQTVAPMVRQCAAPLRQKEVKGRIQVQATVAIAAGRVMISDVKVHQANMDEPELVDCVTKAFKSATFDTPEGQSDVASHKLHIPFVLP